MDVAVTLENGLRVPLWMMCRFRRAEAHPSMTTWASSLVALLDGRLHNTPTRSGERADGVEGGSE